MIIVASPVFATDILKPARVNQSYTILQTCATCTYVNITVSNVEGIIISNQEMTDNGSGVWTYEITPTILSRHDVTGSGDKDGTGQSFVTYFEVTGSGQTASTGDSILYTLFSLILFGFIIILSFFIIAIPSSNEKDDRGFETKIIRIKYVRVVLIFFLYPATILLLNFLNGLATNFVGLTMFAGILGFLFETLLRVAWPFTVIIIAWIIIMLIHDTNVWKQIDKCINLDPFRGT